MLDQDQAMMSVRNTQMQVPVGSGSQTNDKGLWMLLLMLMLDALEVQRRKTVSKFRIEATGSDGRCSAVEIDIQ